MGINTKEERLRIQKRAHDIWEKEGRPEGRHEAHWEQARRECADEDVHAGQPTAPGTGGPKEGDDGAAGSS